MTLLRLSLAVVVGAVLGAGTAASPSAPVAATPGATAVVVQRPGACDTSAATAVALPARTRRLVAAGAELTVVCGGADATAAVIRAAVRHDTVLGAGPDVRVALALAAADHPGQHFGPLR